jgi:putative oxidoreductase
MNDFGAWVLLLGRLLFGVYLAVIVGLQFHIGKSAMAVGYSRQMGFPFPALAGWPAGLWLVASGASIGLGVWPDLGSLFLAAFVIPAAWWFHRFWEVEDENQKMMQGLLFWRNVIFLAAGLSLFAFFAAFGDDLPLTMTGPLFDLSK